MLLLVIGGGVHGASTTFASATSAAADGALILAAITAGLYGAEVIGSAFNEFGSLGAGAWLGTAGGLILLLGVGRIWREATSGSTATRSGPAIAPPAV